MLTIGQGLVDKIVAHARADYPYIACGIVTGPVGSDRPTRLVPMTNAERSLTFWALDAVEQFRVWREMDERDEEPVIIYHSNPDTEAYPSSQDISNWSEQGAHLVIISVRKLEETDFRSFRISGGEVTEEEVHTTNSE
jgi:[CysO sulfur-carrier protein]-S-L-cysteine hydrolase